MARNQISLRLDGMVPLELYAQALVSFRDLILALTTEIAGDTPIQWTVTELRTGSAYAVVTGYAQDIEAVERVGVGYRTVARSLSTRGPIPYSDTVEKAAVSLTSILNGKITAVHLGYDDQIEATVYEPIKVDSESKADTRDLGIVEGVVRAITDVPSLMIAIYDDLTEKRIECFLDSSYPIKIDSLWRKRVSVTGMIRRDVETGRPLNVRNITSIDLSEPRVPNGFLNARGAYEHTDDDEPPEVMIRRLRDGVS